MIPRNRSLPGVAQPMKGGSPGVPGSVVPMRLGSLLLGLALVTGCSPSSGHGPADAAVSVDDADHPDAAIPLDAGWPGTEPDGSTSEDASQGEDASPAEGDAGRGGAEDGGIGAPDAGPGEPLVYRNGVLGESGDPHCARFGDTYYLYLPDQIRRDGEGVGGRVILHTSQDLVHWTRVGAVYDNVDEAYGGQQTIGLWAPEVLAHGGRYYLYYVNVMSGARDERVGDKDVVVIASDDPTDFRGGTRTVLLDDDFAFIDPSPFEDPSTGRLYLLFKRRGAFGTGSEIRIRPLSRPAAFSGEATTLLESESVPDSHQILEHPMMWRQGGVYFLVFSKGDGAGTTYQIAYATSGAPDGTFVQRGSLFRSDADLTGDRRVIAPGASSIVRDGAGRTWMVYRQKTTTADTFADRQVCIDPITIDPPAREIRGNPTRGVVRPGPTPLP